MKNNYPKQRFFAILSTALMAIVCLTLTASIVATPALKAQSHDQHIQAVANSPSTPLVSGGSSFKLNASYDQVFESTVNYLNKSGKTVEQSNKEIGLITTKIVPSDGFKGQVGKNVQVVITKGSNGETSLRVASLTRDQLKAPQSQAMPWGNPQLNILESSRLANQMQAAIDGKSKSGSNARASTSGARSTTSNSSI